MKKIQSSFTLVLSLGIFFCTSFLTAAESGKVWMTDYAAAKAKAVEEQKPLLLEFTGSDWCPPCMRMAEEVFSQPAFAAYAEENLIAVKLDFPRRKEQSEALKSQNQSLAEAYGVRGFPTVILVTPEGEVINKDVGYRRGGAEKYVARLEELLAEK